MICITCHDSYDDRYTSFLLRPKNGVVADPEALAGGLNNVCVKEDSHTLCVYDSEMGLFAGLAEYVQRTDPDIVSGWNVAEFDIPYIFDRMTRLGLRPAEALSRLPGRSERNPLRGRVVFDLLDAYKKVHVQKRESYRLDAIAQLELGETKVRYTGTIAALWREDPRLLVEYNIKDVELCVGINRKDSIVEFYREIARYVGCPLDRSINSSQVVDVYILRKALGRFVLPSKGAVVAEEFEGATVFEPSRGVRENVVVLDLKSLYPMAMMTINASPETKDPEGELRAPNGIRFLAQPDGLTRSIIAELLEERDERKALRKQHPFGSPEYHLLDLQQNVIKVIMNSYYGVSGYVRFRLYDREIGSAVTSVGRAIIEHTRTVIESLGYRVLYGDTDSCMIGMPPMDRDATIQAARDVESALNASYGEFARDVLGADHHYFSIKFEKIYRRFFQAGRKKRYAGHLVWKEGEDVDEIDVVGFELRRSDSPAITKEVQMRVMEMILRGDGYDAVRDYLAEIITRYRAGAFSLDEVGIPGGIGKALEPTKCRRPHPRREVRERYFRHYFSIKFEKIYRRFFQAGRKKRYAGHLVWKEGEDVDEIDVVGFELRRSDSPAITKEVQMRVMEMILRGDGYDAVRDYLADIITRYRAGAFSLDTVGIPGGIGKALESYNNADAHIRGAKYANDHFGTSFGRGSKPKRVYIKNVTGKYPKTDVVAFEYRGPGPARVRGRLGDDARQNHQTADLADHRGPRVGVGRRRPRADEPLAVGLLKKIRDATAGPDRKGHPWRPGRSLHIPSSGTLSQEETPCRPISTG